jgi:hypothetical protein
VSNRVTRSELALALKSAMYVIDKPVDVTGLTEHARGVLLRAYAQGLVTRPENFLNGDPEIQAAREARRPIEDAVEEHMETIRQDYYLTTDVRRSVSIDFLTQLGERIAELAGELTHELVKHGESN